ncbi:MAG: NAD(P)H-dependent oxidoreductase [Sphingomonadales bacterium]
MALKVLRIDSSAQKNGSTSRKLAGAFLNKLALVHGELDVKVRDLSDGVPLIDEAWVTAKAKTPEALSEEDRSVLAFSDQLIDELEQADIFVIGAPVYNFGPSAALKAWIDLIARPRRTFKYTENGPIGLLENKKAFIIVASGGTELGSSVDFLSGYLRHILGFIGVEQVEFIAADKLMSDPQRLERAEAQIESLLKAA